MMRLPILLTLTIFSASCLEVIYHPPEPSPTPTATPEPSPDPSPEPTEAPTAFPTPSPAVSPTPTPGTPMCDLPPSEQGTCEFNVGGLEFEEDVVEAQRLAANNGFVVDGIVQDEGGYTREVARILRNMGLCAISGADARPLPPDEVIVKNSNELSAHWDIVNGTDSSAQAHPAARCEPAAF